MFKIIHTWVNTAMNWLLLSSAHPDQASLTVKFFLTALIPYAVNATVFACGLHVACVPISSDQLVNFVESIVNIVFYALSLVAWIGAAIAFVRKIYLTLKGEHAGIQ